MKLFQIYYPSWRLIDTPAPSRYEIHCRWVGVSDPPKKTNVRKFIRRAK